MEKTEIVNSLMLIDAARQAFNMQDITNRRFMYDPNTCALILGDQEAIKGLSFGSHAEDHGDSGAKAPFDSFVRGWVGTGEAYKHGVIHFAPHINEKNADRLIDGYNTLQMFRENGAVADTVVRGFPGAWEQPLSAILPGFANTKEKESEGNPLKVNAMDETFSPVMLLNQPGLFTNARINRDTVPSDLYAYDIRHDDDGGRAATVEKSVMVNHMGTVILSAPLNFGAETYIPLNEKNGGLNFTAEHECESISEYQKYVGEKNAPAQYYGVWAVRGGGSILGPAEAWSKYNGITQVFTDKGAAERQAAQYNENTASRNVHYYAKEMEPMIAQNALMETEKAVAAYAQSKEVYVHPAAHARAHGELDIYRASNRLNRECAKAVTEAIKEHWDGSRVNPAGAKAVIEQYGEKRVNIILANTVCRMSGDARFSRSNRDWAEALPKLDCGDEWLIDAHPVKLDSFIDAARREMMERNNPGRAADKTPARRESATAKLEAAKQSVKPPAPKAPGKKNELNRE